MCMCSQVYSTTPVVLMMPLVVLESFQVYLVLVCLFFVPHSALEQMNGPWEDVISGHHLQGFVYWVLKTYSLWYQQTSLKALFAQLAGLVHSHCCYQAVFQNQLMPYQACWQNLTYNWILIQEANDQPQNPVSVPRDGHEQACHHYLKAVYSSPELELVVPLQHQQKSCISFLNYNNMF